jgi:hypothetical protein
MYHGDDITEIMTNRVGKFVTTLIAGLVLLFSILELSANVASWEATFGGTNFFSAGTDFLLGIAIICIIALSIVVAWDS